MRWEVSFNENFFYHAKWCGCTVLFMYGGGDSRTRTTKKAPTNFISTTILAPPWQRQWLPLLNKLWVCDLPTFSYCITVVFFLKTKAAGALKKTWQTYRTSATCHHQKHALIYLLNFLKIIQISPPKIRLLTLSAKLCHAQSTIFLQVKFRNWVS